MSLELNKAIIRRLMEAVSEQNLSVLDELIAPDFVEHTFQLKGLESMKQTAIMLFKGFPDLNVTIENITAEGDKVWDHVTAIGTHTGQYRGVAPTGKKITFSGVRIWRIIDGKITERKTVRDMLEFLRQIGIIESTEKAKQLFPENVS